MKNLIVSSIFLFGTLCSFSQDFQLKHDHSTIQVIDIEKSVAFYSKILSLNEIETPWPENKMIRFFETGRNQQLHIGQVSGFGEIKVNKVLHLAFAVNDFDAFLKHLKAQEISYSDFQEKKGVYQTRPDGVRQIYFQDPDGYWIEVNDAKH